MSWLDLVLGRPLRNEEGEGEHVGPLAGVPVLGLDAIASAAYGPEALLTVLLPLGIASTRYLSGLTAVTLALLLVLYVSYRQTIDAYPNGGGAYTVVKENLGQGPSLLAAAALALDYVLNVAVAISAGVGALVPALPSLLPHTLGLCLLILLLLMLVNLRGIRASAGVFMVPTYAFIACLALVLMIGLVRLAHGGGFGAAAEPPALGPSSWLLMRAFASGCTAMTGVEAVSNGVPIFRDPAKKNAKRTLTLIILVLGMLLAGIALLARGLGVAATRPAQPGYRSVLSQITERVVGHGALYYATLAATLAVLCLSANTSFADFPRLCRFLALDRFLPEALSHRGRRLTFSHGIVALTVVSGVLLVIFRGITDALIPLFAVGALLAFTASQSGMVMHWWRRRGGGWSLSLNALGALSTGATACIVLLAKFREGAWISAALIASMVLFFRWIRRHYDFVARATAIEPPLKLEPLRESVTVVPIRRWDAVALNGLRVALGFPGEIIVVQVLFGDREEDELTKQWDSLVAQPLAALRIPAPRLVVLRSTYRQLFGPVHEFLRDLRADGSERELLVVIPELIDRRWYRYLLHGHSATWLKLLLLHHGTPGLIVVDAPWYLRHWLPERRRLFRRGK